MKPLKMVSQMAKKWRNEFPMANKMMMLGFILLALCTGHYVEAQSAKHYGMGNIGVAYPQDALSTIYNPANATEVGDRWDSALGALYTPYEARISENPNPAANITAFGRRTWVPLGAFGINKCFCNGLALNFTISNRFFHKTHYDKPSVLAGTSPLGHGYERYAASTVLAYSWQCHHFGIALDFLVGRHKEIGVENFDSSIFSVAPGHVTNRGYDWNFGVGVSLGWLWDVDILLPGLKVGVKFAPETKMSRFHKYKGVIPSRGIVHNTQEFSAGLSYRFLECATFSFDYRHVWTRRLRAIRNPVVVNPFIVLLGSEHGTSYGLRNETFYKFGLDYAISDCWVGRIGYIYAPQTNRSSQAFLDVIWNIPETNFLTLGSSFECCCWDITLFYLHGFEKKVKGPVPAFLGGGKVWHKRSITLFGMGFGRAF